MAYYIKYCIACKCTARKRRRIGYLMGGTAANSVAYLRAFREGMASLGWVDKRDYVIEDLYGNGVAQAIPALAEQLVASRPDILMTGADDSVSLLAQRTKTIPIVFALGQDPVRNGFAASLRRPGGNVTGLTNLASELAGKRLQLLKEAFPRVNHVALLFEPANVGSVAQAKDVEDAAPQLKMRASRMELRELPDIETAFKRGATLGVHGYVPTWGAFSRMNTQDIVDGIARSKLPAIYTTSDPVEQGGLMSYAPSNLDNYRRVAIFVDKIFKGAKPGDLPIEQPTKFEMVLNQKTAKAMGFKFPQTILLRADRIIE